MNAVAQLAEVFTPGNNAQRHVAGLLLWLTESTGLRTILR